MPKLVRFGLGVCFSHSLVLGPCAVGGGRRPLTQEYVEKRIGHACMQSAQGACRRTCLTICLAYDDAHKKARIFPQKLSLSLSQ